VIPLKLKKENNLNHLESGDLSNIELRGAISYKSSFKSLKGQIAAISLSKGEVNQGLMPLLIDIAHIMHHVPSCILLTADSAFHLLLILIM
jgi:hypothetical protein